MSAEKTCADGTHVDIDISKTAAGDGKYKDACDNTINVHKTDDKPDKGYKRYTHRPVIGPYYIGGIYYNRVKQDSIKVTDAGLYEKRVTVYYLGYDITNALPLIVGLKKNWGSNRYYYYTRTNLLSTSSTWTDNNSIDDQESQLLSKLPGISSKLTGVVLNLTKPNGTYYANGEISKPPPTNPNTQIQVTGPDYIHTIYKRYKHSPVTGGKSNIRLLSTKTGNKNIPFDPPICGTLCSEAYVYYWNGDPGYSIPLLLELESTSGTFYYILDANGNSWNKQNDITKTTLKKDLDKQNCSRNDAHILDISQKGSSSPIYYNCPSCDSNSVKVSTRDTTDYSYSHLAGSFSRFKDGKTEQTGLAFTSTMSTVFVYYYPKGSEEIPLLIHFPYSSTDNPWYQRDYLDSSTWKSVINDKPNSYTNDPNILKLLKTILPTVTIDVGEGKSLTNDGQSTSYEDTSGGSQETISLRREDVKVEESTGYTSFTHSIHKKEGFILGGVKYGEGTAFSGLSSSFILKSVTAYYSGEDGFKLDNLLLVGFEKRGTGSNNYEYYIRGGEDKNGTSWTLYPEQKTELKDPLLAPKLKNLKETFEAENKSQAGGATGERGGNGVAESGSQNFGDRILKFIESHPAEIGGVGGTIGTGILGALAMWKGPALIAKLITRL